MKLHDRLGFNATVHRPGDPGASGQWNTTVVSLIDSTPLALAAAPVKGMPWL